MNSSICLSFQFIAGRIVRPAFLFLLCRDSGKLSQDRALVFIEGELEIINPYPLTIVVFLEEGNHGAEVVDRIEGGEVSLEDGRAVFTPFLSTA